MKSITTVLVLLTFFNLSNSFGQINGALKNKVKNKVNASVKKNVNKSDDSSNSTQTSNGSTSESKESKPKSSGGFLSSVTENQDGMPRVSEEELNQNPYSDEDRLFVTDQGQMIIKGNYRKEAVDPIDFSGFYYLNTYGLVLPANHFSSDTTKAYGGFTVEYSPENYNMNIYWEEQKVNNAVILEQYQKSADKGNLMFQMGMLGGPESFFNANCLLLEPGVFLIGANVYHKNDEEGHYWMNNIEPKGFIIAAKDTTKFKDYQSNVQHTSKVVFEKFDALRRVWKQGEIEDARPLPSEGMQNSKLKGEALALIKKTANAYGWKETVEYAYITSSDWDTRVSALTGKLLTRSLKCIVVMKTPDGNYKREGFYIGQKHNGSAWGNTYMLYNDQLIYYVNPKDAFKYK